MNSLAVVMPAGGRSVRFGRDKLLEPLAGRAVITHAVAAFLGRPDVSAIYIATLDPRPIVSALSAALTNRALDRVVFVEAGECRAQSVQNALKRVPVDVEWVAVHDAARPLLTDGLIDRVQGAAYRYGAAAPALPVALTIKRAAGPLPAKVEQTVPRKSLWAMQTPQVMRRADLLGAYDLCPLPLAEVTDDSQLLEMAGHPIWLVPGEERNIKLTTAVDLRLAEELLTEVL